LSSREIEELDSLIASPLGPQKWTPLPGPQTEAYYSPADILFYGGAAGGGKSDLVLGLAHQQHRRSIIFRREFMQLQGLEDRAREIYANYGGFNSQKHVWRLHYDHISRVIEFGACQRPGDEQGYQGRPHDLKAFDELTHFTQGQFRYLIGWTRSPHPGQRSRVVCTGNPPTSADGDWVIEEFAPWLDDRFAKPKKPGELMWATTDPATRRLLWLETGDPIKIGGELVVPKSRTFIPAKVDDNPYYMSTGYKSTLQALPEPLRSKMLSGDFKAGREDDPFQVIPTLWVEIAQERWRMTPRPGVPLTQLGVDVARGGNDKTVISPRFDVWFGEQHVYPGSATPDGDRVRDLVIAHRSSDCNVVVDVVGVGSSPFDSLRKVIGAKAFGFNGAAKANERARDKSGMLKFYNLRAQAYWALREALDPANKALICLPPDPELKRDLCAAHWELTLQGIKIEPKDDITKRIGRSPDKADSLVYASFIPPSTEFALGAF
jgi:hypothetical protein